MADPDITIAPESESSPSVSIIGSSGLHEFIRYFAASALALIADVGSLWLLTSVLGVPYLWSGAIAFLIGLSMVYVLSVRWVFEKRALHDWRAEFLVFALIGVVGLGLNELVLWLLTGYLGLFYLFSKAASVVVVFSWNFGARKWLLFRENAAS
jgi:putative flippase GtrA